MPALAPAIGSIFLHEREGEDQHARHGKKQRRVQNFAALHLDGEVLFQDEQGGFQKHGRYALPTSVR